MPLIRCIANMNNQVLLIESYVTIGTIQSTQPACFEYIDTIVGIRLDKQGRIKGGATGAIAPGPPLKG